MIPRYSRPDMVAIWSPETKFRIWYEIEAHACDAQADLGVIPRANAEAVWKAKDVTFDVARIDEIEAVTKEFKIIYQKVPGVTPNNYSVDHSAGTYIFDKRGKVRLFATYGADVEELTNDVRLLLSAGL